MDNKLYNIIKKQILSEITGSYNTHIKFSEIISGIIKITYYDIFISYFDFRLYSLNDIKNLSNKWIQYKNWRKEM